MSRKKQIVINIIAITVVVILMVVVLDMVSAGNFGMGVVVTPTTGVQKPTNNTIINNQNVTTNEVPIEPNNIIYSPLDNVIRNIVAPVIIPFQSITGAVNPTPPTQPQPTPQQNTPDDTGDGRHLECRSNVCMPVEGEGPDLCNLWEVCSTDNDGKHMGCVVTEWWGHRCILVDGEGPNLCTESTNCSTTNDGWHLGCVGEKFFPGQSANCTFIKGEAPDECDFSTEGQTASCSQLYKDKHLECTDAGNCEWVEGQGWNQCDQRLHSGVECAQPSRNTTSSVSFTQRVNNFFGQIWTSFLSLFRKKL